VGVPPRETMDWLARSRKGGERKTERRRSNLVVILAA